MNSLEQLQEELLRLTNDDKKLKKKSEKKIKKMTKFMDKLTKKFIKKLPGDY